MKFELGQKIIDKVRGKNKIRGKNKTILYKENFKKFKNASDNSRGFKLDWKDKFPCLFDDTQNTSFDTHYEYHQAWAARCLAKLNPQKHVDISSKITFNVVVSAFVPIDFYDYRPAKIYNLNNLECKKADLTNLPFEDESIESLSCMHTIEHIGLGRYGDEINPNGDLKAIEELKRVLKKNGNLLFVVPIGEPRIQFNAHRIYSYEMIMNYFENFEMVEYALIPDNALETGIIYNATKEQTDIQKYGCGCFWFRKQE